MQTELHSSVATVYILFFVLNNAADFLFIGNFNSLIAESSVLFYIDGTFPEAASP